MEIVIVDDKRYLEIQSKISSSDDTEIDYFEQVANLYPFPLGSNLDLVKKVRTEMYCARCFGAYSKKDKDTEWIAFECGHLFHSTCCLKTCRSWGDDNTWLFEIRKLIGCCSGTCPLDYCELHQDIDSRESVIQMHAGLESHIFPKVSQEIIKYYGKKGSIFDISNSSGKISRVFWDGTDFWKITNNMLPPVAWKYIVKNGIEKYAEFASSVLLPYSSKVYMFDPKRKHSHERIHTESGESIALLLEGKENANRQLYEIDGIPYFGLIKFISNGKTVSENDVPY